MSVLSKKVSERIANKKLDQTNRIQWNWLCQNFLAYLRFYDMNPNQNSASKALRTLRQMRDTEGPYYDQLLNTEVADLWDELARIEKTP